MRGVLILSFILGGVTCSTASQTNVSCEWPNSQTERLRSSHSLSADAEFAEDLAIRHADACCGLGSPGFQSLEQYAQARDVCMAKLFQLLGQEYGVSPEQVREALGQRPLGTDLLIMLSYGVVYAIVAYFIVRWLWRRIGQEDPSRATVISGFGSLVVALIGAVAGEIWCDGLEMVRLGNGHLSYRETRVPWTHHRLELFFGGVLLFLLLTAVQWFRIRDHQIAAE